MTTTKHSTPRELTAEELRQAGGGSLSLNFTKIEFKTLPRQ